MLWILLLWPPVAFLLAIGGASAVAVRSGADSADAVSAYVTARVPTLLAVTLALVGLSLLVIVLADGSARDGLVAAVGAGEWVQASAVGVAVGAGIAAVYFGGLDRVVLSAQARFGDYVPVGSTTALGAGGAAFFVANVILAPLVEELWYRGLLFDALAGWSPVAAALVGCLAFGAFHWPGGAWYVVVTGVLVGGACWALRAWDGGLAGPYAAHLTLNVIEFVVLTRAARRATLPVA